MVVFMVKKKKRKRVNEWNGWSVGIVIFKVLVINYFVYYIVKNIIK